MHKANAMRKMRMASSDYEMKIRISIKDVFLAEKESDILIFNVSKISSNRLTRRVNIRGAV